MKKGLVVFIFLLLLCRFLYPHTRFGYVSPINPASGTHLNIQSATMKPGEKLSLKLVSIKKIAHYSSSDFRIASVSATGTVHALNPGTVIIFVRQGTETYRCKIKVTNPA